jgi:hypothetical protein
MSQKPTCRLIFTEICNRSCDYCCNKQYNFNDCQGWKWSLVGKYQEINISGGEPMLFPEELRAFIQRYRALEDWRVPTLYKAKIYLYTAFVDGHWGTFLNLLRILDGATVTLHDAADVDAFLELNDQLNQVGPFNKSLRLSVFGSLQLPKRPYPLWNIMTHRQPREDCPVPEDDMLVLRHNFER